MSVVELRHIHFAICRQRRKWYFFQSVQFGCRPSCRERILPLRRQHHCQFVPRYLFYFLFYPLSESLEGVYSLAGLHLSASTSVTAFRFQMLGVDPEDRPLLSINDGMVVGSTVALNYFTFSNLRFTDCGTGRDPSLSLSLFLSLSVPSLFRLTMFRRWEKQLHYISGSKCSRGSCHERRNNPFWQPRNERRSFLSYNV